MYPKLPTKHQISKHWASHISKIKQVDETCFYEINRCFACLMTLPLQRAHIIDRITSNNNNIENLHLLCYTCHRDSEYLHGDAYWEWLRKRTTLDTIISMAEFEGKKLNELTELFTTLHKKWRKDSGTKIKLAIEKKKLSGLRYGNITYGKMLADDAKTLIDNPLELKNIELIVAMRKNGLSCVKIATQLDALNIKPRNINKLWAQSSIRVIVTAYDASLQNPRGRHGGFKKRIDE